jgi:uncharacterized lipoprotein YddW (UPF0748 family)
LSRFLFFLAATTLVPTLLQAQPSFSIPPKCEVRAVWLATATGLDWPKTYDRKEQQNSLRKIVQDLKTANFNTIFFQARTRGDAYYRSHYEPWAENLTGTMGQDPGWDPLAFLINEAHRVGIEVHAWINVYKVRSAINFPSSPLHPVRAYPAWVIPYAGEYWLDPGIPEVRSYLVNVVMDLVRNYDVDGINFDYMRYPGHDFADDDSYRRYGGSTDRDTWRLQNITRFVTEIYDKATAIKPMLKVGSSPVGVAATEGEPESRIQLQSYYQDAPTWLRMRKQDYISPQIYWDIGSSRRDPDFAYLIRRWRDFSAGRHMYAGIAAYKPEVAHEITAEIDTARSNNTEGESYFRYENIQAPGLFGTRYLTPANIPPMAWKDAVPPLAPTNLAVSEVSANVFALEWKPPLPASDGDRARYYNIYRSTSPVIDTKTPLHLIAVTQALDNTFIDTVKIPTGVTYHYAVAALDKGNNEGPPSSVASASIREMLALKNRIPAFTSLSTSFSHDVGTPTLVAYRLERRSPVQLSIYRQLADGRDSLYSTLINEVQNGATYVVGLGKIAFRSGRYAIRMRAGEMDIEQTFNVAKETPP